MNDATAILKALAQTHAGKSLKANLRYLPFKHETEDRKHWKKSLGPSSITFSHLKRVHDLTDKLLRIEHKHNPKKFTVLEQQMLRLAAVCHDLGEAILDEKSVGDVPAPLKKQRS